MAKIEHFLFCGSIGDPIYATEFLEIIEYIKRNSQVRVRIVTNGSYKKTDWWLQLAQLLDYNDMITFSVDGWDHDSNNQYRINSNFDSILEGIRTVRKHSACQIRWSTIYFSFNQHSIDRIREVARSAGCDTFQTVKSSKFDGRYLTGSVDTMKPADELVAETAVYETAVEQLKKSAYIPIVPAVSPHPHAWAKCLNYQKDMFVGIDGLVVPCPWFDNTYQPNRFVLENQDRLSIRHRSFFEIIDDAELWSQLTSSFESDPLPICKIKCKNAQ
jgi:MoaA/NifB/PqqE/SkfB family radical SAM enzyme